MIFIKKTLALLVSSLFLFTGCELASKQPEAPVLDLNGRECDVTFGKVTYTAKIFTPCIDKTVIEFTSPEGLSGTQYTFCENTLELECGELAFSSDMSYLPEGSLPAVINTILSDIRQDNSLVYSDSTADSYSGKRYALYNGNNEKFDYTVKTDFESGIVKEIYSDDKKLSVIID